MNTPKIQIVANNENGLPISFERWEVSGEPSRVGATWKGKSYSLVFPLDGPPSLEIWTTDEEGSKDRIISTVLI